jgi:hypothetical protein
MLRRKFIMKKYSLFTIIILMLIASVTNADSISIPASAFSGRTDGGNLGYLGNESGTARFFNVKMFAAVNLPDRATVTSFRCGGRAFFKRIIAFTLRRNDPQQSNVDLATIRTSLDGTGFEFVGTNNISSGTINNARFNYYIIAEIEDPSVNPPTRPFCPDKPRPFPRAPKIPECSVGFCSIEYTEN